MHLLRYWGARSLPRLARDLGRTKSAIRNRINVLGYGSSWQGTVTLTELARRSGYSRAKIVHAAKINGVKLRRAFGSDPRQKVKIRRYALKEDTADRLIALMLASERAYADAPGATRTTKGKWGIGRKPPACLDCGTLSRPHLAKGLCSKCYEKRRSKRRGRDTPTT